MMWNFDPWYHAQMGLLIAAIAAIFCAWIASIARVHGRAEPGRAAFIFLEVMMILYMLFILMGIVLNVLIVKRVGLGGVYDSEEEYYRAVRRSMDRQQLISTIQSAFGIVFNALLLFSLVELGNGLMFMLKKQRSKSQKMMRYFALILAPVMFIFMLAVLPLRQKYLPRTWRYFGNYEELEATGNSESFYSDTFRGLRITSHLSLTYHVLNLVTAITVLVYASFVMHAYRTVKSTRGCAIAFLAMAILFFIRAMWLLVSIVSDQYMVTIIEPQVELLLTVFFEYWICTAIVLTLFFVALKKQGGLWTTEQPWMTASKTLPPSAEEK